AVPWATSQVSLMPLSLAASELFEHAQPEVEGRRPALDDHQVPARAPQHLPRLRRPRVGGLVLLREPQRLGLGGLLLGEGKRLRQRPAPIFTNAALLLDDHPPAHAGSATVSPSVTP